MSRRLLAAIFMAGVAVTSCKVITEEMPAGPSPIDTPTPKGTNGPKKTPRAGETPTAEPTAAPTATPTAKPTKTPEPEPTEDDGRDIPDNDNPVVKVGAVVYYVSCPEGVIWGSKFATEGPARCNVRLDCTPKDEFNKHTRPQGEPVWTFGGDANSRHLSWPRSNPFTPQLHGDNKPGTFTAYVRVDGVQSNTITFTFK
jgi:hypothetical protein